MDETDHSIIFPDPSLSLSDHEKTDHSLVFDQVSDTDYSPVSFNHPIVTSTPIRGSRRQLSLPRDSIEILTKECCTKSCMRQLSIFDIEEAEEHLKSRREADQLQYILGSIWMYCKLISVPGHAHCHVQHNMMLNGTLVCPEAWCLAHNCTKKRFTKCITLFKRGVRIASHGNRGKKGMRAKGSNALAWMRHVFPRIGDFMPHKTQVHLPVKYTKRALWKRMCRELKEQNRGLHVPMASYTHFIALWNEHLSNYIIPKRSEFTECADCTNLGSARQAARTDAERQKIQDVIDLHIEQVQKERQAYDDVIQGARRNPDDYTVLAIDGMDQKKTDVPHLSKKDKDTAHLARLPVHVTGVLIHTKTECGKKQIIYTDTKHVPHDSNLTVNLILDSLFNNKDVIGKRLFLQLDNCYRENKNKYLLAMCTILIDLNIFEEVVVHFLPVGHTHIDVDQLFSRISVKIISTGDIFTLDDMHRVLAESSTPAVKVIQLPPIFDFKEWITPHFYGRFGNHSKPHWFFFQKTNGQTLMQYKKWVQDDWLPEGGPEEGLHCLKSLPDVNNIPNWVYPCIERMEPTMLRNDFARGYDRMPADAKLWWNQYLSNMEEIEKVPDTPDSWLLADLQNNLSRFQSEEQELPELAQRVEDKQTAPCHRVFIGNQGRGPLIEEVDNVASHLTVGCLVAINLDEENGSPPFIGKVTTVSSPPNDTVEIQWMKGGWKSPWKLMTIGRKPYCQDISIQSILLFDIKLNAINCLTSDSVKNLKEKYREVNH